MSERNLTYREALSEGLVQAMERDDSIFVTGIAVDYSSGIFGTTSEALRRFGPKRVFDAPAMENALAGIAIGAAAMGKRPVVVHPRADFAFLAMDQLVNLAAKWKYMFAGRAGSLPLVVRAVIGRGWGQGATHSQSLQSIFAHFPGIAVVMPASPGDAKGLTAAALAADHPTVILEYRTLYESTGPVAEDYYREEIGRARTVRIGKDVTIVAASQLVLEAIAAAKTLADMGIDAEIVDPRSIRPLDESAILASVRKTGRLIVADTSWSLCGFASEIAALAAERAFAQLRAPVRRITLPDCPAPVSYKLEEAFYPGAADIVNAAASFFGMAEGKETASNKLVGEFKGPY
ncbi:MAG: alpha-ketoacid dehydrogenase subunit beta [Telmatospirillum sp.]|nr:alpha-ketoacid dehydrogenase subunit beta [Telmatospirillum sp.]